MEDSTIYKMELKKCKVCNIFKSNSCYPIDKIVKKTGLKRRRRKCKECYTAQRKEYFKKYYIEKLKKK